MCTPLIKPFEVAIVLLSCYQYEAAVIFHFLNLVHAQEKILLFAPTNRGRINDMNNSQWNGNNKQKQYKWQDIFAQYANGA